MRRSALIIVLLAGSPTLSPALAGQASAVIHVGITITGNPAQSPPKARASGSTGQGAAGLRGGARPAALKRSVQARPQPPQ